MDAAKWISAFKTMHETYKRGSLNQFEKNKYLAMRDELARSLMDSMNQQSKASGVSPRRALAMPQLYAIELQSVHKVMTRELSCQGFVAHVPANLPPGELVTFTLTLGRSVEPVQGDAIVQASLKQGTQWRVVADFKGLMEGALQRIEDAVFDAAVERLK